MIYIDHVYNYFFDIFNHIFLFFIIFIFIPSPLAAIMWVNTVIKKSKEPGLSVPHISSTFSLCFQTHPVKSTEQSNKVLNVNNLSI